MTHKQMPWRRQGVSPVSPTIQRLDDGSRAVLLRSFPYETTVGATRCNEAACVCNVWHAIIDDLLTRR